MTLKRSISILLSLLTPVGANAATVGLVCPMVEAKGTAKFDSSSIKRINLDTQRGKFQEEDGKIKDIVEKNSSKIIFQRDFYEVAYYYTEINRSTLLLDYSYKSKDGSSGSFIYKCKITEPISFSANNKI